MYRHTASVFFMGALALGAASLSICAQQVATTLQVNALPPIVQRFTGNGAANWVAFNVTQGRAYNIITLDYPSSPPVRSQVTLFAQDRRTVLASANAGSAGGFGCTLTWTADRTGTVYGRVLPVGTGSEKYEIKVQDGSSPSFIPGSPAPSAGTPTSGGGLGNASVDGAPFKFVQSGGSRIAYARVPVSAGFRFTCRVKVTAGQIYVGLGAFEDDPPVRSLAFDLFFRDGDNVWAVLNKSPVQGKRLPVSKPGRLFERLKDHAYHTVTIERYSNGETTGYVDGELDVRVHDPVQRAFAGVEIIWGGFGPESAEFADPQIVTLR